ncbi:hypothetical protein VPH35_060812 [Triticum aestivum]|uniref:Uncharacterized protein n=1 Tax=Aegilops tauschii subsp. strangulata TaxID=200361 RepID=A0A453FIN2_AEGTS
MCYTSKKLRSYFSELATESAHRFASPERFWCLFSHPEIIFFICRTFSIFLYGVVNIVSSFVFSIFWRSVKSPFSRCIMYATACLGSLGNMYLAISLRLQQLDAVFYF